MGSHTVPKTSLSQAAPPIPMRSLSAQPMPRSACVRSELPMASESSGACGSGPSTAGAPSRPLPLMRGAN